MAKPKKTNQTEKLRTALKSIPNKFAGKDYTVELFTDELTSCCPFTGLPDFYKLHLTYIPTKKLVELKSLKLYLVQFRDIGLTHEDLLNIIFEDLLRLLKPRYIKIELNVNIRGGIKAVVQREQGE